MKRIAIPLIAIPLITGALVATAAGAQQPGDPARDRTGPNAAALPLPPLDPPAPTPSLGTPAAPATGGTVAATVTLADVRVIAEPADASAAPLPGWQPITDAATGLKIDLLPGERFDAAWTRRQFEANGLIGAPVPLDRLVGLVQLVNLAFVRNGYVNSGLLLGGAIPREGGTLDVRLIFGRTVGADPVDVAFGPGGAKGLSEAYVRARMASAAKTPFNAVAVEREFRLLAQDPAIRTINADLRPGQVPGEATLAVTVTPQERFDAYASIANSRSPSIGG